MKRKKGFTVVELVIIIAVIAILAAVLIPTFSSIVKKANESTDIQTVRNLNTAIKIDDVHHNSMHDALAAAKANGFAVEQVSSIGSGGDYFVAWDSVNDRFVIIKKGDGGNDKFIFPSPEGEQTGEVTDKVAYFVFYDDVPAEQTYSIYLDGNNKTGNVSVSVGFDVGENYGIESVAYTGTVPDRKIILRTNNTGTNLDVSDTTNSTISHFGDSGNQTINSGNLSFHEYGGALKATITGGHYVAEGGSIVVVLDASASVRSVTVDLEAGSVQGTVKNTNTNTQNTVTINGKPGAKTISFVADTTNNNLKATFATPPTYTNTTDVGNENDNLYISGVGTAPRSASSQAHDHNFITVPGSTIKICSICGEFEYTKITVDENGQSTICKYNVTVKFPNTDKYLYRVGNQNAVSVRSLFEGNVSSIDVTNIHGDACGNYTNGNITFSGTGVVKVTANGNVELLLEVVDGKNATTATSGTNSNVVLLNDVSTNSLTVSGGHTLYGNGFKVTDTRTSPTPQNNQNGYVTINNGTVDNVQFIGYEPKAQNLFNNGNTDIAPAVKVGTGGANIYNCYISGGRYALQADSCNIVMIDTILDGGAIGNAYLTGGNITMENCVTTMSTRGGMKGLGICIPSVSGVKLNIKGSLKQYNWSTSSDVPSDLSSLISDVYSNTTFAASFGGKKYVNTGIFFLDVAGGSISKTEAQKAIYDTTDNNYDYFEKTAYAMTGCCYTAKATMFSEAMLIAPEFTPNNYYTVPAVSFDHTKNYKAYSATENYCIEEGGVENIQVVKKSADDAFEWDPYIMTISAKYGNSLTYTVKLNGTEYARGSKIKFDTAGDYNVEYIYTDPYNFDKDAEQSSKKYTQIQKVHVTTLADYHPQFSYVGNWQAGTKQVVANDMVYIMPNISETSEKFGSTTVGGQTIYYPIVDVTKSGTSSLFFWAPAFSAINIKDLYKDNGTTRYTYNSSSQYWPHGQRSTINYSGVNKQPSDATADYGYIVTTSPANSPWHSSSVYADGNNGNASTTYNKEYGGLCFYSSGLSAPRKEGNQLVQFWYRGDDGIVYRYYIQYHFPETKYTVEINCGSDGTVDKSSVLVSYKDSLTADGNKLKNGSTVVATATPNTGYAAVWSNLPSSVTSNKTGNSAVKLTFVKDCTITINCGEGGTVSPATVSGVATGAKITAKGNQLLRDGNVIATAKPSSSDCIAVWSIPNETVEDDMTVGLTFVKSVTIYITAGTNGSVSPTSVKVAPGKKLTTNGASLLYDGVEISKATANSGYSVDSWSDVPTTVITANTTVKVSFKQSCVAKGTLITLADGTQVPVETLTGDEMLLVWNLETGKLDSAPIMFIDSDPETAYEVINLYFSDGTDVKVISEHGFWDYDLNEYVYLDENASAYIGHAFAKHNGSELEKVQLVDVSIETETTTAWSPVTFGHLCYFVDGMLSMPGGISGLFNIFEVDAETMAYDVEKMQCDIETYGLLTVEDFGGMITEEMFEAFNGKYLGIAVGKGNLTWEFIAHLAERYAPLCD